MDYGIFLQWRPSTEDDVWELAESDEWWLSPSQGFRAQLNASSLRDPFQVYVLGLTAGWAIEDGFPPDDLDWFVPQPAMANAIYAFLG